MANAITKLITALRGQKLGTDRWGNIYYQDRKAALKGQRRRRWVVYAGGRQEASLIPPTHYDWLHYGTDEFPKDEELAYSWMKPREENATGTAAAWRPQGHVLRQSGVAGGAAGGEKARQATSGDYQAWDPNR